jgi:hypothetical protein
MYYSTLSTGKSSHEIKSHPPSTLPFHGFLLRSGNDKTGKSKIGFQVILMLGSISFVLDSLLRHSADITMN